MPFVHGHNRRTGNRKLRRNGNDRSQWLRGRAVGGRGRLRVAAEDRGYETRCWIWTQPDGGDGYYGRHTSNGTIGPAHRSFYEAKHGPVPDGLELDHLCSQPACVNPHHLEAVTATVNKRRGRATKLTLEQAREIKALRGGPSSPVIAQRYGISAANVRAIWAGRSWMDA